VALSQTKATSAAASDAVQPRICACTCPLRPWSAPLLADPPRRRQLDELPDARPPHAPLSSYDGCGAKKPSACRSAVWRMRFLLVGLGGLRRADLNQARASCALSTSTTKSETRATPASFF